MPTKRVVQVTYTWNIGGNEYSSKHGNTYSCWFSKSISSLPWGFTGYACLAPSCIMSFFVALPTFDCLVHHRNSIRVSWLFRISFSLLLWSARWFIHMRSNRSRLVSLNPLRLARHWLYYLFVSFNKCLFSITRMHIFLHFFQVLNNSRNPMFAR